MIFLLSKNSIKIYKTEKHTRKVHTIDRNKPIKIAIKKLQKFLRDYYKEKG